MKVKFQNFAQMRVQALQLAKKHGQAFQKESTPYIIFHSRDDQKVTLP